MQNTHSSAKMSPALYTVEIAALRGWNRNVWRKCRAECARQSVIGLRSVRCCVLFLASSSLHLFFFTISICTKYTQTHTYTYKLRSWRAAVAHTFLTNVIYTKWNGNHDAPRGASKKLVADSQYSFSLSVHWFHFYFLRASRSCTYS